MAIEPKPMTGNNTKLILTTTKLFICKLFSFYFVHLIVYSLLRSLLLSSFLFSTHWSMTVDIYYKICKKRVAVTAAAKLPSDHRQKDTETTYDIQDTTTRYIHIYMCAPKNYNLILYFVQYMLLFMTLSFQFFILSSFVLFSSLSLPSSVSMKEGTCP